MNDEKLLNLAGGKILYKDLRDRIEETSEEITQTTADVLRYTSQDLTEEQKEQARDNIGAVSVEQMDAELNDLWDETDSINDKTDSINNTLAKYNCVELLKYKNYTSGTVDGVSFQWADSNTCAVSGTPTAAYARWRMHYISHEVSDEQWGKVKLVPGGTYFLHFNSPSKKVKIEIEYEITQSGGSYDQFIYTADDTLFTIPMSCSAVSISLAVPLDSGEVNETVEYGVCNAPSNMELWNAAVKDVQVNGASILQNGVANVPLASTSAAGVAKVSSDSGITMRFGTTLAIVSAGSNAIKSNSSFSCVTPNNKDAAVFYGLAKAAGHDEKNSTEPLGTYTPEAKGAIQQMLGVSDLIAPAENDLVASQAYAIGDVFTANGKLYKVTTAIAANDSIVLQNEGETISGANAVQCKVEDGFVKFTDYPTGDVAGVIKTTAIYGTSVNGYGQLFLYGAPLATIKAGSNSFQPIMPAHQHEAAFYGMAKAAGDTTQSASSNAVGTYTESAKSAISQMLNGSVSVSGTTPTITALPGIRYVCGEVMTLDITLPDSGIVDVVFESGSTPTVLTVTPPTGVTVKWANGFDPEQLEVNASYSLQIIDGKYGVATVYGLDYEEQQEKLIYSWYAPNNYEKRVPLEIDLENNRIRLNDVSGIPDEYRSQYTGFAYLDFDPITSTSTPGSLPLINKKAAISIKQIEGNWVTISTDSSTDVTFQSTCALNGWYLWIKTNNNQAIEEGTLANLDITHKYIIEAFITLGGDNVGLDVYMKQGANVVQIRGVNGNSLGNFSYEAIGLRGNNQIINYANNIRITGTLRFCNGIWMLEATFAFLSPNNSSNTAKYIAKQVPLITAFNNFDGFDHMVLEFGNYMPVTYGSYLRVYDAGNCD